MTNEKSHIALDTNKCGHRQKKWLCPACGKKRYVRYYDFSKGKYLLYQYGRCDREESCGYWVKPEYTIYKPKEKPNFHFIDHTLFLKSLKSYPQNHFFQFLVWLFGEQKALRLAKQFHLGTSKYWEGATVFWQVDSARNVRSGKIIQYDSTNGKRVKNINPTWVHKITQQPDLFELKQCFFGEHQLTDSNKEKTVAIVEAAKTAIIAAEFLHDQDFIWLSCENKNGMGGKLLNIDKCKVLSGRDVVLFPDLSSPNSNESCFNHWSRIAQQMKKELSVNAIVSNFLENKATEEMKNEQWDLADFLIWANEYAPDRGQFFVSEHLINYDNPNHKYYMPF